MKNKELYDKTVNILVDAYFNDTLEHGNCSKCAVGNLVSASGIRLAKFDDVWDIDAPSAWDWRMVFYTETQSKQQFVYPENYRGNSKKVIDATGYKWQELARIEKAFETAPKGKSKDQYMFNGLMAVIEVLDQIHHNTDTEVTKVSKQRFVKQPA